MGRNPTLALIHDFSESYKETKMTGKLYTSNALWPEDSGITDSYGKNQTSDSHNTMGNADGVCIMLERKGFGWESKIFPLQTWTGFKDEYS